MSSNTNCGDCGIGCTSGKTCVAGVCSSATLKAQFMPDTGDNKEVRTILGVVNIGGVAVDLMTVTLRYWYTSDISVSESYDCFYVPSPMSCADTSVKIVPITARTGADHYFEVGFKKSATLAAGASFSGFKIAIHGNPYQPYDYSNDYSYTSTSTMIDWSKVTVYIGGSLVWGTEP
jgi:cellulose 1,4-beta-cellobiosidase